MLYNILICLYISVKSRTFAVEKERETNITLTLNKKHNEVQSKNHKQSSANYEH